MALSPHDTIEITQLYARYNQTVDSGDGDGFAACFAPEGVLQIGAGDPISGRDALADFARSLPTIVPGIRHHATNVVVDGGDDDDDAIGSAYLLVLVTGSEASIMMTGRYQDLLRRENGRWAFVRRFLEPDA